MNNKDPDEKKNLLNLMGLGEFSGKKNYFNELEREKIQFERIFSEALNGILQVKLTGEIIICNPAFFKMCGFVDYRDFNVSCKSIDSDIFINEGEFFSLVELLKKEERIIGYETQFRNVKSDPFFISLDAHIQNDSGNTFVEFFIQNIDIRKRAQKEIDAVNLYTENILNAATLVSIISTDLNGVITRFNRGAELMLGYKAEELEGKNTPEVIHLEQEVVERSRELSALYSEDIRGFETFVKVARIKGSEEREWTYVKKDGERITVNLSVTAIKDKDNDLIGFLGVAKDVTKEKEFNREVIKAREMIRSIMDSMPSLIIGVDSFITVTHWNMQAEVATGVNKTDAIGKSPFDLYPLLMKFKEEIISSIDHERTFIKSKVLLSEDHNRQYKDITIYPLFNEGFKGGVIRVDDVTEKVRLEELIVQSEKMLSVGGLAAGMAHEINNPLAGIIQNIQNIQRRLFTENEKNLKAADESGIDFTDLQNYLKKREIHKMLAGINFSGLRAAKIVRNMLSFSRGSRDDFILTDIRELVSDTIHLAESDFNLKKNFDFKKIKISWNVKGNIQGVMCESSKIQQVIYNILKNGTEAMHRTKKPQFIITIYSSEKMIIIEIEDNGHGMSEKVRKRIFEPFFSTKSVGEGTGLGMSVSYFIICDLHKGELSVDSVEGKWTKFTIKLPIKE